MLRAMHKVFEEEAEGASSSIKEVKGTKGIKEVKRVCKAADLAILQNLLPHVTSLLDRAVKQEASVRVVTHGDFHQWNMAFDGEPGFPF